MNNKMSLFPIISVLINKEGIYTDNEISVSSLDKTSLRKYLDGDEEGFIEIFNRHRKKIFNIIYSFIRNVELAEDLTQDTFMKFIDNVDKFDFKYAPSTLLYKIAERLSINKIKSSDYKKKVAVEKDYIESFHDDVNGHDTELFYKEIRKHIAKSLEMMKPEIRMVFIMKQENQLKFDEIAESLKISVRTAKRHLKAAVEAIGKNIKKAGINLEGIL